MRPSAALRLLLLLAAAALAACGGGGGGGDGGSGGGPGGGATSPPAFEFNDGNALTASALALRVIEQGGLVAELPLVAAIELDQRGVPQFNIACGNGFIELRNVDADGSGTISTGDSVSAEHVAPCSGVSSSKITMRLSAVDLRILRLEGAAEFELESAAGDRIVGTFSLATSVDSASEEIVFALTNLVSTSTRDGKTERLSGGRFDRRYDVDFNYSFDFAGELDSDLVGGRYSFSTPVRFAGAFGLLPDAGELVSVAGRTRVRIAVSPLPEERQVVADYQLDTGSGYGSTSSVRWREVTTGLLFFWIPNDPPVISSLEVSPPGAHAGDIVTANAVATDPDGDPLSFEFTWAAGQATYRNFGPVFSLAGLEKGDTVSVTVRVSDGRAEANSSTSFSVANAPPAVTSLTIDPAAPRSIDDLTATAAFEDLDGDSLAVRYEWLKNGTTIPGATGATLPRSAYAKNDVVTVTAYVSDGSVTVSEELVVTIGDSLPQLTWLAPLAAIPHGAPFSVRAVATDPDGEALPPELRFELRYGPAGMAVDPLTGEVTWLAGGPMFERSMNVRYGVGTNLEDAASVSGEVVVEDPDRQYPLARSSIDPATYSGLRAGDFDGDGDSEILMLTDRGVLYELEAVGDSYRQAWMYPFSLNPEPMALATADVDGDGAHEIFLATGNLLLKLDGVERRVTATATLPVESKFWSCADLDAADLDADGAVELVCSVTPGNPEAGSSHPLIIFDSATLAVEGQIAGGNFGNDFALGNVDDDAALEIVTWRGFVFDGVTLQQEWANPQGFGLGVAVGDVTGDGVAEIVAAYGNESGTVGRVFSALSRGALFELPHLGFTTNLVADIDGAAPAEILMAGSRFAAYRYEPSGSVTTLFSMVLPNDRGATTLAVANVDRAQDPWPEFVMGTNADTLDIADWPAENIRMEWSSADLEPALPQTLSAPFFGGELVRSPSNAPRPLFMSPVTGVKGARLFTLDPVSGDLAFSPEVPQGASWFFDRGDLAVTDFDGDGTDEAFMSVADVFEPAVGVYDFFAGQLMFRSDPLPAEPAIDVDHGDFNGDGRDELVALTGDGWLRVYDVFAGALLWSELIPADGEAVAVADLDGASPPEIIATTYGHVLVFSRDSASASFVRRYEWSSLFAVGDLTAGDVDGDGSTDIFVVTGALNGFGVQRFNERLEPTARLVLDWEPASLSIEFSAFGRKNLVGTYFEAQGSRLRALDPLRGEEIWRSPPIHGLFAPNSVHFVDIAGDGVLRIAYGTYHGVFLTR